VYLVHLRLLPHPAGELLPERIATLMTKGGAADVDGVETVALHPTAQPCPVVGVYVRAESLVAAEAAAVRAWGRAVLAHPPLAQWELISADVPLLRPDLEL
jgi:hypothetical protein